MLAGDTEVTERQGPGLMESVLLSCHQESVILTCLLANREESWSMSMMIIKSSSTHFLISRPLTYNMKKRVVDKIRNYDINKYFDFLRGEIVFFPSNKKAVVSLPEPTLLL